MRLRAVVSGWTLVTRGVASVLIGIAAFALAGRTLSVLTLLLATYLLVNGAFALIGSSDGHSWAMKVEGAVDIYASVLIVIWPGVSALLPTLFVAAWAVLAGSLQIWTALRLHGLVAHEWPLLLGGVVTIVLAITLWVYRGSNLPSLYGLIGEYAVVWGEFIFVMAFGLTPSRLVRPAVRYELKR
jgi:uncharacterized membrane protein HdeD (DUF308 family)